MAKEGARQIGQITKFNDTKGFGFIKSDKLGAELFVHHSDIKSDDFRTLFFGSTVELPVSFCENSRLKAVDVTGPNSELVWSNSSFGRDRESRGSSSSDRCGKSGHITRDCLNGSFGVDRGCFSCGESGHVARECQSSHGGNGGCGGVCHECKKPDQFAREFRVFEVERDSLKTFERVLYGLRRDGELMS